MPLHSINYFPSEEEDNTSSSGDEQPQRQQQQQFQRQPRQQMNIRQVLEEILGAVNAHGQQQHESQRPSAPPAPEPSMPSAPSPPAPEPAAGGGWTVPPRPGSTGRPSHCHRRRPDDHCGVPCMLSGLYENAVPARSRSFGKFVFLLLSILLLPSCLVSLALFLAVAAEMRWPVAKMAAAWALLQLLWLAGPFVLKVLAVYALVKVVVWKRPVVDRGYWRNRCRFA